MHFDWLFLKGEWGISIKDTESVIDSGTTLMYFSKEIFDEMIEKMIVNSTCENFDGIYFCDSNIDLPNIYFSISRGHSYELKPEDYGIYYQD